MRYRILPLLVIGASCLANTVHVPEEASSIQLAVNQSASGDTILVANGVYEECVEASGLDLCLIGESRDGVCLAGDGTGRTLLNYPGANTGRFNVSSITFDGSQFDTQPEFAVEVEANSFSMDDCLIQHTEGGIYCWADSALATNLELTQVNHRVGILFYSYDYLYIDGINSHDHQFTTQCYERYPHIVLSSTLAEIFDVNVDQVSSTAPETLSDLVRVEHSQPGGLISGVHISHTTIDQESDDHFQSVMNFSGQIGRMEDIRFEAITVNASRTVITNPSILYYSGGISNISFKDCSIPNGNLVSAEGSLITDSLTVRNCDAHMAFLSLLLVLEPRFYWNKVSVSNSVFDLFLFADYSDCQFEDVLLFGNTCTRLLEPVWASFSWTQSLFINNTVAEIIHPSGTNSYDVLCCDFYGNTDPLGENIDGDFAVFNPQDALYEDPLFCDSDAGDFRLQLESPCWDHCGEILGPHEEDCDGNDVTEEPALPTSPTLGDAYPNPFNPVTTIPFTLPQPGHFTLQAYNLRGQLVQTLADTDFPAGEHIARFDASHLASGLYIVRLSGPCRSEARKVLLVR